MDALREQFEAWLKQHKPDAFVFERDLCWQAYQAGHAVNTVNADLLEALRKIELAFYDSPAHGELACKMAGIATAAIKKARGEA